MCIVRLENNSFIFIIYLKKLIWFLINLIYFHQSEIITSTYLCVTYLILKLNTIKYWNMQIDVVEKEATLCTCNRCTCSLSSSAWNEMECHVYYVHLRDSKRIPTINSSRISHVTWDNRLLRGVTHHYIRMYIYTISAGKPEMHALFILRCLQIVPEFKIA